VGLLLLAGCSSSSKESAGSSGDPAAAPQRAIEEKAPVPNQAGVPGDADKLDSSTQSGTGQAAQPTSAPVDGRSLIFRASLTVRVDDVAKASDGVTAMVTTAGGFVASEKRAINSRESQSTVTVRVPSKGYADTLERLAKLGREENRSSNVEDVTEAIVDLDTRIAAQKASVESVRRMFERAGTLQDVVLLEKELTARQAELASLEARKNRMADLVALSTITLTLVGPNTTIAEPEEDDPDFLSGIKSGWKAFVASLRYASAVFGFLLPFLVAIGIPLFGLIWLLRLRGRRRTRDTLPS
jgi:hypothetical protein